MYWYKYIRISISIRIGYWYKYIRISISIRSSIRHLLAANVEAH